MFELHKYLNKTLPQALPLQSRLTAVHAHVRLTTSALVKDSLPFDFFDTFTNGIRIQAEKLSMVMDRWFRYSWWKLTNGVITDFILSNNLIEESIRVNLRRFLCIKDINEITKKYATFPTDKILTGMKFRLSTTMPLTTSGLPDSDKVDYEYYDDASFELQTTTSTKSVTKTSSTIGRVIELSSEELGGRREKRASTSEGGEIIEI